MFVFIKKIINLHKKAAMKSIYKLFAFILFVFFTSCSSDGDETIDTSKLVGTWNLTSVQSNDGIISLTVEGVTIEGSVTISSKDEDATITIAENPNTFSGQGSFTQVSTISLLGNSATEESVVSDLFGSGTWSINNNVITVDSDSQVIESALVFKIKTLTTTTLVIEQQINEMLNLNNQDFNLEATITYSFSK